MTGKCAGGRYQCGNPSTFVLRNEGTEPGSMHWYHHGRTMGTTVETCGKHLASVLAAYPIPSAEDRRFLVVPCNPNIELLQPYSE